MREAPGKLKEPHFLFFILRIINRACFLSALTASDSFVANRKNGGSMWLHLAVSPKTKRGKCALFSVARCSLRKTKGNKGLN